MSRPISYWWDFRHHKDGRMTVIVECDHPKADGRTLAEFNEPLQADALIADLREGRKSMHTLLKEPRA